MQYDDTTGGYTQSRNGGILARAFAVTMVAVGLMVGGDAVALALHEPWRAILSYSLDTVTLIAVAYLYLQARRYAGQLREAYDQVRSLEQLRENLAQMLVHDFKNPLGVARGALEAVTTGPGAQNLRPRDMRLLRLAYEAHDRLDGMIGDLLVISQAEQDCLGVECYDIDLGEIAGNCVRNAQPEAEAAGVRLVAETHATRAPIDVTKIERVVDNLLANALKYTPPGGVITVGTKRERERALLWVSDTGMGVAPEDRERIFEKFGQGAVQPKGRKSVGLGLAFCKYVVEAHGGRLWVEDSPEGGAVFRVELPTRRKPAASSPAAPETIGRAA